MGTPLGPVEREGAVKRHGPVKIGVTLPLSGEFHEYGERLLTGIEMAVKELNDRRGISERPVELAVLDNRGNPALAADQVDELSRAEGFRAAGRTQHLGWFRWSASGRRRSGCR